MRSVQRPTMPSTGEEFLTKHNSLNKIKTPIFRRQQKNRINYTVLTQLIASSEIQEFTPDIFTYEFMILSLKSFG